MPGILAADGVYEILAELVRPGVQPQAGLTALPGGIFYGVASAGGAADAGAILRLDASGTLETLVSFSGVAGETPGRAPLSELISGADGALWGTTLSGGSGDFGTVFRWVPDGVFESRVSFTGTAGTAPGAGPNGLVLHVDGNFYGSTQAGGGAGLGTLFRASPAGGVTNLGNFSGVAGNQPGSHPVGPLTRLGAAWYGVTLRGGPGDLGTVFRLADSGGFSTLVEFSGQSGAAPGAKPSAGLVAHTDGNLYGTCSAGGTQDFGTLFQLTPAGALTVLHHFLDTDGSAPSAELAVGADGALYGSAAQGGAGGWGVFFRCTTGGGFSVLAELTGTGGARRGAFPLSPLTPWTDGNFYGATSAGGGGQDGGFFRMTPTGAYTRLAECSGTMGWAPAGAPAVETPTTWISPMALGGPAGVGTLVRQTGNALPVLAAGFGGALGDLPAGSLLRTNTGFFGVTAAGGTSDRGTFYRFAEGTLTALNQHTNPQGAASEGPLTEGPDGNFYGVAREGGSSGNGTLFKVTPAGVRTRLVNLTGITGNARGSTPRGPLALALDGNFYGACTNGGAADQGVLFRLTPTGTYSVLVEFAANGPRLPQGGLTTGNDGLLYGSTGAGGAADAGTLFFLNTAGVFTPLAAFTGGAGALPGNGPGVLSLAADGTLYGLTESGGASGQGTIFRLLPDGTAHTLTEFTGLAGAAPGQVAGPPKATQPVRGGLTSAVDGWIYGAVPGGGKGGGGVLFRVRAPTAFETWRSLHFPNLPPSDTTDLADPDEDGYSNLIEYALGTSPTSPGQPLAPRLLEIGGVQRLSIGLTRNPAQNDLTIAFEASSNLSQPWQVLASSVQGQAFSGDATISGDGPGPALREVILSDSALPAGSAQRFVRLRVTRFSP